MPKLNQIIAIEKGVKSRVYGEITEQQKRKIKTSVKQSSIICYHSPRGKLNLRIKLKTQTCRFESCPSHLKRLREGGGMVDTGLFHPV